MSRYSLDSLESIERGPSGKDVSINDNDDACSYKVVKSAADISVKNTPFYLNPILTTDITRIRGTKYNGLLCSSKFNSHRKAMKWPIRFFSTSFSAFDDSPGKSRMLN